MQLNLLAINQLKTPFSYLELLVIWLGNLSAPSIPDLATTTIMVSTVIYLARIKLGKKFCKPNRRRFQGAKVVSLLKSF